MGWCEHQDDGPPGHHRSSKTDRWFPRGLSQNVTDMNKPTGTNPESLPQGFMSLETAANWCDVSRKTVQRWLRKGLPCFQEGPRTKVLIRPCDIEAFLTKRQAPKSSLDDLVESVLGELQG